MTEAKKQAIEYFWPNRWWGGYAKFFNPCIPARIGIILLENIRKALKDDDQICQWLAVEILSNPHTKRMPEEVICYPTEEAKKAIEFLKKAGEIPLHSSTNLV